MKNKFAKNIHLMMLSNFSGRINFFPILSIYYLTLNNTFANEVGIYMGAGFLAGFLLEIPSGYFSDLFGHKKTIILGKISFLISVFFYIFASFVSSPLIIFILAMFFQMLAKVAQSGSDRAILYDSLKNMGREKEFTKIQTKLSAVSSLLSTIIILGIPFFTKISIIFPFYIVFLQYLFGLGVSLLLADTENHKNIDKNNKKKIREIIKENKGFGLFPYLLFGYLLNAVLFADAAYRPLYMEELGLPIVLMGSAMGISRFMWYVFYPLASKLENKFSLRQIYLGQLIFLFMYYLLISYLDNPYVVAILFGVGIGFIRSLKELPSHFIIKNIKDKNYKATMLSVAGQIGLITQAILTFAAGFIMSVSYKLGFFSFAIIMLVILGINYIFILKSDIEK